MTARLHHARWPVREHLRPKDGWALATEADVRPDLLAQYHIVDEFNGVQVWIAGEDGPTFTRISLSEALALAVGGEA